MKVGIILDNFEDTKELSTNMLIHAFFNKKFEVHIIFVNSLYIENGKIYSLTKHIEPINTNKFIFYTTVAEYNNLEFLDCIFIRKRTPFEDYNYMSYIFKVLETKGVFIPNRISFNEKLLLLEFPKITASSIVSKDEQSIINFHKKYKDIILKSLDNKDTSSFRIKNKDKNRLAIISTLTKNNTKYVLAQEYNKNIKTDGRKYFYIVNGNIVKYAIDKPNKLDVEENDTIPNQITNISESENKLLFRVAKILKRKNILFTCVEMVGDNLININVSFPTALNEIYEKTQLNIASLFVDSLKQKITQFKEDF